MFLQGQLNCAQNFGAACRDAAKVMLLLNSAFIPHLIDGLMLDPSHPRLKDIMGNDTDASILSIVQRDFAHCISQISLFPPGCEALKADPAVLQALSTLRDAAWSDDARLFAEATLMVLSPPEHLDLEALHVMMSCTRTQPHCSVCVLCAHGLTLESMRRRSVGRPGDRKADR